MMQNSRYFSLLILVSCLFFLSGCQGAPETASQEILPVAVPGNAVFAIEDAPPIFRNQHGEPIRQDKVAQGESIQYSGLDEE